MLLVALLALGACKRGPEGVAVTEAAPVAFPEAPGRYAEGDTTYADVDSLVAADSLAQVDSSAAASPAAVEQLAPDFTLFWAAFRAAARSGRRTDVAALAVVGPGGIARDAWPQAAEAVTTEPFRARLLALDAPNLAYDGGARTATLVVGYNSEGAVVPQDEADADASLTLRFETVDAPGGRGWRLVRAERAG